MGSRLIKLDDGTLVEIEVPDNQARQIAGNLADKVDASLNKIKPVLLKACQSISSTLHDINDQIDLEQVEVELGLSFETEGNIYIAKATMGANILVRMTLKNK